jgi:hypothetical protein
MTKIERNTLRWFDHVERIDERRLERFMKHILMVMLLGEGLGERFLIRLSKL